MENIRQAIERAKAVHSSSKSQVLEKLYSLRERKNSSAVVQNATGPWTEEIEINSWDLFSKRIVSHIGADQRSRPYDMLRTQVLQSMDLNGWKIVGVTSPTPGCGKTLTAINLAFSIARQPDHAIALVDMDLRKPQIAKNLGLYPAGGGVLDLLKEQTTLQNVVMPIRAENQRIVVVPTASTRESSELMNSRAMSNLLQNLRRDYQTIVVDLPPILSSDDVIRLLPQLDCVILVAAVGHSKLSEVEESKRHLQSSQIVRIVLNKAARVSSNYYYY